MRLRLAIGLLLIASWCMAQPPQMLRGWASVVASVRADSGYSYWTDPASGQASHWNFESNATVEGDSWDGNGMTNVASATWTVTGTNGDGGVEHGYTYNGSSQYHINRSLSGMSATSGAMSVWFKRTGYSADYQSLFSLGASGGQYTELLMSVYADIQFVVYNIADTTWKWRGTLTQAVPSNTWTHLMVTHDGAAAKFYLNGILTTFVIDLDGDVTAWTKAVISDPTLKANNLTVGSLSRNSSFVYYFPGLLDDPRFYTNCPTSNQVFEIYSNTHPTNNLEAR